MNWPVLISLFVPATIAGTLWIGLRWMQKQDSKRIQHDHEEIVDICRQMHNGNGGLNKVDVLQEAERILRGQ